MTTPTQKLAGERTQIERGAERLQQWNDKSEAEKEDWLKRTQHTPGPWEWQVSQNGAASFIEIIAEGWGIAHVYGSEKLIECQANARLIAAAPKLLEACRDVLRYEGQPLEQYLADHLRAAIAAAEGRAQ